MFLNLVREELIPATRAESRRRINGLLSQADEVTLMVYFRGVTTRPTSTVEFLGIYVRIYA